MFLISDNANESVLSVMKEASTTSADSSFDITSSVIPGYQLPRRKLTTPFSPGRKTPELFTPSSKSQMVLNTNMVILCSQLQYTLRAKKITPPLLVVVVQIKPYDLSSFHKN